jgi:hypothetical protein
MKHKLFYFATLLICFSCLSFVEQNQESKGKVKYDYVALLGCTPFASPLMNKNDFDRISSQSFCAKDSANAIYKISAFDITFAERGLYQDSTGLPIVVTDYSSAHCTGDTIPKFWINAFKERSYKGDTIFFDNIIARGADNKAHMCKQLKFIIQ